MKGLYDDSLFPGLSSHNTDTFVYYVLLAKLKACRNACQARCRVRIEWPSVCTEQIPPGEHLGKWRFLAQSTLTPVNGPPILPLLYSNTQGFTGHIWQANNYIVPCDISRDQVPASATPCWHYRLVTLSRSCSCTHIPVWVIGNRLRRPSVARSLSETTIRA